MLLGLEILWNLSDSVGSYITTAQIYHPTFSNHTNFILEIAHLVEVCSNHSCDCSLLGYPELDLFLPEVAIFI